MRCFYSALLTGALLIGLPACHRAADEPAPADQTCYSGVIRGFRCPDGLLIAVDPSQPLGKRSRLHLPNPTDTTTYPNVIAGNFSGFSELPVGTRIYFTIDPKARIDFHCPSSSPTPLGVPQLGLANVSAITCLAQ